MKRKIVVGVTGASGAPYAKRLLSVLAEQSETRADLELGVVMSETAAEVWALECGSAPSDLGITFYGERDFRAPFASGSAGWHAMAIVPCSMSTAARIATGSGDSLLTRAADVMLKERRTLVIVPRETPMSSIHLDNLLKLSNAGAVVLPASPSFYGRPATLTDAIDTVVARVLDHLQVEHSLGKRWGDAHSLSGAPKDRAKGET